MSDQHKCQFKVGDRVVSVAGARLMSDNKCQLKYKPGNALAQCLWIAAYIMRFRSIDTPFIMRELGISRRTVLRHIQRLRVAGLKIEPVRNGSQYTGGYTLFVFDELFYKQAS